MKKIKTAQLKQLVEAAIFVADAPVSIQQLRDTVLSDFTVAERTLKTVINELTLDYQPRGIQLVKVASGYRFQSVDALSPWLSKLWQETAPKYSRAMLETLALIAYRQPITRGEIEQVRGVAVSSSIMKTLTEREWVKVVGHKEVPGRPALYATTHTFLDYFSLSSLSELPNSDAFDEMAKSTESTSSLKVLNEAPSEVTDRATENKQIKSDTND
ncbi:MULTISPECIES: SMC-Scp complex subunit ScpB [Alteromonas]|jgi:segregation and condensation protein B|uniref:SMC-Scp complex subunit ScpB n=1 Tax=Alteromonas stellipolaris TaxID=233316 RepID=A0AAW7Z7Y6_9ALTE|nr:MULTISPECIES: SMC-Scp complex subunit ScpB [Alteromonas]AMJ90439.1 segregation and condensation protein B [Alteromonas sp. Mac2]ALM91138.1 Segregation and condensation protein B [Alteromonas stellipolaris LMG 21856]AMJ74145.1 segregation and condensation protein B [Alteromonas stellipolaris]AMJ86578.1 segregation and condensation protein B [Alteromonas sp. Mac1]AMJ94280.1 segregation and condensation protein B [Alteromonas stellipolaris]